MVKLLGILLLIPCAFGNPLEPETHSIPAGSCGVNKYGMRDLFIVGGKTATPNTYPWMASLQRNGDPNYCGGSIIGDQYILTAAHCVDKTTASSWTIVLGKHDLAKKETGEQTFKVTSISRHEKYVSVTTQNDVAVIKLSSKIVFDDNIQPICIPSSSIGTLEGTDAIVTGWGDLADGGATPTKLQEVHVPIMGNSHCQNLYKGDTIDSGMLCAGYDAGGKDHCFGDSGGPLIVKSGGKWTQVGIVSWAIGCAEKNHPGVYTRVSNYVSWIKSKMV